MRIETVIAASGSSRGKAMGDLVAEGILTKYSVMNRMGDRDIVWTNVSNDVIVDNGHETINPGETITWES
jgi:hypothetical protein